MSPRGVRRGREDDREAFLRSLRALRARRGLSIGDVAARTHFPEETLAAAETGPDLPSLPVLEAYLRGCGEDMGAWEDRWRRLTPGTETSPDLPVRDAGSSPAALAGAAAGASAVRPDAGPGDGPQPHDGLAAMGLGGQADAGLAGAATGGPVPGEPRHTIVRLGAGRTPWRPGRFMRRYTAAAAAVAVVAVLAAGSAVLLSRATPPGHRGPAAAAPRPARNGSSPAQQVPVPSRSAMPTPGVTPSRRVATPAKSAPARHEPQPSAAPASRPAAAWLDVAGIGCPENQGGGVSIANAPTGPGWNAAGGGWAGNGCDGSAVWTMNPNGNQPTPSTLTWFFRPRAGVSRCALAVFVPAQNALGVSDYAVYAGDPATSASIGTVPVSQAGDAGQWVTLGSYPVSGTPLEIVVAPASATLDAAGPGSPGNGNGNGNGHGKGKGPGGGPGGPGHNSAIAASAAAASCA